jgi:hypothetical protein
MRVDEVMSGLPVVDSAGTLSSWQDAPVRLEDPRLHPEGTES